MQHGSDGDPHYQLPDSGFTSYQRAAASVSASYHKQSVLAGKAGKSTARLVVTCRQSCSVGERGKAGLKGHRLGPGKWRDKAAEYRASQKEAMVQRVLARQEADVQRQQRAQNLRRLALEEAQKDAKDGEQERLARKLQRGAK
jgi:hypothetical protein